MRGVPMRVAVTTSIVLALLAVLVLNALPTGEPPRPGAGTAAEAMSQNTAARRITAEARVVPEKHADLSFKFSGRINQLPVKKGQRLEAGQVLARLEDEEWALAVKGAEAALALAEAQLAQLQQSARAERIALTRANLEGAQAKLDRLLAGPTANQLKQAEIRVNRAKDNLHYQNTNRDFSPNQSRPSISIEMGEALIGVAWEELQLALTELEALQEPPRAEDVAQARAAVEAARQELLLAQLPYTSADLRAVEARVEQARVALEQAKLALREGALRAPYRGTVADLLVQESELVRAGQPVAVFADLETLQLETTDLEQGLATKVRVGQKATVTVEALDNREIRGEVVALAQRASLTSGGEANFTATIRLAQPDPELRWGMTTKVEFVP